MPSAYAMPTADEPADETAARPSGGTKQTARDTEVTHAAVFMNN